MVYTVTFNPSLDYIISLQGFQMGTTNRTKEEQMLPGGKGINVSTVLQNLGIDNTALGFTAGFNQDMIFPMIVGKLVGGITAVFAALILVRNKKISKEA